VSRLSSPEADVAEATETDEVREAILERVTEQFGDAVLGSHLAPGHGLWIRVPREAWVDVHRFARMQLGFGLFDFVSAIDWLPSPFGKSEDASVDESDAPARDQTIVTGVAGGDTRFQVFSHVTDVIKRHIGLQFKADVADDDLRIDTLIGVYAGANWHEREMYEMFGIEAVNHPYLAKLYLPGDFEGFPLRKDFPLVSRMVKPWPGIVDVEPMPGGGDEEEEEEASE
jgi:NADH-quinone oxidoreductase subunit C